MDHNAVGLQRVEEHTLVSDVFASLIQWNASLAVHPSEVTHAQYDTTRFGRSSNLSRFPCSLLH
jgi:hypothetical protein